ncbi:mitochondrial carrier domain-containing protein [Tribonema minus]|uniref:Mitochondrial carrier domain-containing protein n=1 Tax=Tribonema minus TaxID=303371 RepID=A0A836CIH5_9STRA|nr:mitochondrial carrier domain-containing protein [Tribonema minus]
MATSDSQWLRQQRLAVPSLAGAGAGIICSLLCSPLDVAKTRIQVQGALAKGAAKYTGVCPTLKTILAEEGIQGWYKGITPALVIVPVFWGIYFGVYEHSKGFFRRTTGNEQHVLSAMATSGFTDTITNPFWVVRTRMQTQVELSSRNSYRTTLHTRFPLYERLKAMAVERRRRSGDASPVSPVEVAAASAASKLASTWVTYPNELLRARMQDQRSRTPPSLRALVREIVRTEGVRALWTGFRVNMVRVLPSCMATFVSYELIAR